MDTKKIGIFLSQLRREKALTQEQLGEKLGVTNKTISRWENGNYLPPAETLQDLSEFYGITINEILSGERLSGEFYKQKAEENIKTALQTGPYIVKDQLSHYKKKWMKDHLLIMVIVCILGIAGYLICWGNSPHWQFVIIILMIGFWVLCYNLMMAYAEGKLNSISKEENDKEYDGKNAFLLRRLRITGMVVLCISLLVTSDLAYNYFSSQLPEINDGITIRGWLSGWIFGDDHWSRVKFFKGFITAMQISGMLGAVNLVLACLEKPKKN